VVSSTPGPHYTPGKDPVPILLEAGWAPGPVWTGRKSRPHQDSIPDRPARSSVAIPTELPGPRRTLYQLDSAFLSSVPTAMWTGPMLSASGVGLVLEARTNSTPNVRGFALPAVSRKQTIRQQLRWQAEPSRPAFFLA